MSFAVGRTLRALPRSLPRALPAIRPTITRIVSRPSALASATRPFTSTMTVLSGGPAAPMGEYDSEITDIAKFAQEYEIKSDLAIETARLVLLDTLGCGLKALEFPECVKLLGPPIAGQVNPHGTRVPGTAFELDPVNGAFSIGAAIRWLDFNDCWLAAEWGHPSDQLGAYLAVADWINRTNKSGGFKLANGKIFTVLDVLKAMIKGHEIQGVLALENSLNRVGLDHVSFVRIAATANVAVMLGLDLEQTKAAISQALVDGFPLRTYRHAPNAGPRKSWAAGQACQRAVDLCLKVMNGQPGIPTVLSAKIWGLTEVALGGKPWTFQRPYGSYVMENVLFKVSYPAEFHSQSAVEAAEHIYKKLQSEGKSAKDIEKVVIRTHEACIRIIDKRTKPMTNYTTLTTLSADRDHTIQYMVSCMLVTGRLEAEQYLDESPEANDPLLESLRQRIYCEEDPQFTADYHDPNKRYISNALTVHLRDGTVLDEIAIDAPLGHKSRREESKPAIMAKYERHIEPHFSAEHVQQLMDLAQDSDKLLKMDIDTYNDLYVVAEKK